METRLYRIKVFTLKDCKQQRLRDSKLGSVHGLQEILFIFNVYANVQLMKRVGWKSRNDRIRNSEPGIFGIPGINK